MHVWYCDITHDVTALIDDVTSENKRMCFGGSVIMKLPENGCRTLGRDHPDHRVVRVMPHPPLCIWAHPHDQSLQPLYLSTLFYNLFVHTITNLQMQGLCSFMHRHLRGPPPPTPLRAPPPPPPLATPAQAGLDILGSSHHLWHRNPTTGH